MGYSLRIFLDRRDEFVGFIRWINLIVGLFNLYLFIAGGGYHLLGIGALNMTVWVFTRRAR